MPNFIQAIDSLLGFPAMISGAMGAGLMLIALIQLRRGRFLLAGLQGVIAVGLVSTGTIFLLLGLNLYTYQRLTLEQDIARITFWRAGPQQYLAVLTETGNPLEQNFLLTGDEWQIDARILKWTAPAIVSGLDSRYRLERLSGRYQDIQQERLNERSAFDLSPEPGLAIWPVLARLTCCLNWIDAYFGNSTYLPMADQASYQIILTQSGIMARPENENAKRAVREWN
jgi:hypothetical protein